MSSNTKKKDNDKSTNKKIKKIEPKVEVVIEDEEDIKKKREEKNKYKQAKKKIGIANTIFYTIAFTLLIVLICLAFIPLFKNLKFGLDLQGGFEILYKATPTNKSKMTHDKLVATYKTLSKRIDGLGVSEPEITLEGEDKIRVKLAGVSDPETARTQLSTVATLTFRDTNDNLLMESDVLVAGGAKVSQDSKGKPAVSLSIKNKDKFYAVTNKVKDMQNNLIVIWLDFEDGKDSYSSESSKCGTEESNCLSAATVSQAFASDVIIQGNFTEEEVENLVDLINSGSLPSKLTELSSNTVGASFGDDTLEKTLYAGIIGIVLIILLLIIVYHYAGFISAVSIMLYTFLVFLTFWLVGGVLTLPSIAALVLGVGMAVDSNIIMFSRIKDELYKGRSLPNAFKEGSKSSLSAILDSNLTTLVVAIIMFIFGESSIKGFATMLIITIIVTMLTMVLLTRVLLNLFVKTKFFNNKTNLFINVKSKDIPNLEKGEVQTIYPFKNVNFLKPSKILISISCLIIIVGVIFTFARGLNLGIDYRSGTNITINSEKKLTKKELTNDLKELGLKSSSISISDDETSIRIDNSLSGEEVKSINTYFEDKYKASVTIGVVSNEVAKELAKNALLSVLVGFIGIIIYVSFRFKLSNAIGGVIALIHDVLIICSFFSILHLEISSMFIAALLAIIGYSINDTIVLFDRIRENIDEYDKKLDKESFYNIVLKSIQETFTRTIYTTITTLLPILALIILGSSGIFTFNIAMLIGLLAGTYSSIFIATFVYMIIEEKHLNDPKKKKKVYEDEIQEKMIKGVNC